IGRPQESTQSERRSTPRFEKGLYFLICHLDFVDIIVFQQHDHSSCCYGSFKWEIMFVEITRILLTDYASGRHNA
ncbi:hypothetical protein, partial [Lysinibacillus sp. NPDC047702]|uniref:hypothetical protein n=1 Tax=unclassified Lysinibacillus TaxID=2636778 RepID=UPI003D058938